MLNPAKVFANCSFIFQPKSCLTWSFEEFVFQAESLQIDNLFVQEDLWQSIQETLGQENQLCQHSLTQSNPNTSTIEQYKIMRQEEDVSLFDKQDRNYFKAFFQYLDESFYTHQVETSRFTFYLLKRGILSPINLIVYNQLRQTYDVESGQIYGVQFMLYEPGQKNHKHSKILVHLQNQTGVLWSEIYRLVRLAQEVKKRLIIYFYRQERETHESLERLMQARDWNQIEKILNIVIIKKSEICNMKPN